MASTGILVCAIILKKKFRIVYWVTKMAQMVQVFATKPGNLSLIPEPTRWEEKTD